MAFCAWHPGMKSRQREGWLCIMIEAQIFPMLFRMAAITICTGWISELSLMFICMAGKALGTNAGILNWSIGRRFFWYGVALRTGDKRMRPVEWKLRLLVWECQILPCLDCMTRFASTRHFIFELSFVNIRMACVTAGQRGPNKTACTFSNNLLSRMARTAGNTDVSSS